MDLPKTLSFVNYAVNGAGVGHVQRLSAINRWLRRYATFLGIRSQHWFITTSEADTWLFAENFAAFKLPSKSIVEPAGINKPQYMAMAKQWVWTAMSTLRPDLFISDTFPNGSFDELAPALDLCAKKALILRPVRPEILDRPGFRALIGLYDRVVIPTDLNSPPDALPVDPVRVGPILLDERFEMHDRAEARRRLGVEGEAFCVLVSGGGGGDAGVPALFEAMEAVANADPSLHLVYAAGPLSRLPPRRGARRTWWTDPGLGQVLSGVDAAVSAAGFNSVHELLHAGVPTAFLPQRKIADDQEARAQAVAAKGAGVYLASATQSDLGAALGRLRDPEQARRISEQARRTVARNAARDAAAVLLELCVPRALVRQAMEVVDDALLADARARGIELGELVDVALALGAGQRGRDRSELDLAGALAVARAVEGLPAQGLSRLAALFGRKLVGAEYPPGRTGPSLIRMLSHPGTRGQWAALATLLNVWPQTSRDMDPERATGALLDLVDAAATRGLGVSRLAQVVVQAQGEEAAGPPLMHRIRARLEAMA